MTRDARLSALHRGGFGPRGRASVSFGARRPTTAGSCLRIRAASSSQPGRSAWRATSRASRGERLRAACRRTPLPAPPSGCLRRRPSKSEDGKLCSIASECSQYINTVREYKFDNIYPGKRRLLGKSLSESALPSPRLQSRLYFAVGMAHPSYAY